MSAAKGKNTFGLSSINLFPSSSAKIFPIMKTEIIDGKTSYNGYIVDGKKHGQGVYIDRSAHVQYKGEWVDDNIHGFGTIQNYFEGFSFTGTFENNRMIYGTMTWANGTVYKGYFENNQLSGLGTIKWPDNSKYEGMFTNGRIKGFGTYTDNKGNIYEKDT